jgi:hypothetical protein
MYRFSADVAEVPTPAPDSGAGYLNACIDASHGIDDTELLVPEMRTVARREIAFAPKRLAVRVDRTSLVYGIEAVDEYGLRCRCGRGDSRLRLPHP